MGVVEKVVTAVGERVGGVGGGGVISRTVVHHCSFLELQNVRC